MIKTAEPQHGCAIGDIRLQLEVASQATVMDEERCEPQALVLNPTRELASQNAKVIKALDRACARAPARECTASPFMW